MVMRARRDQALTAVLENKMLKLVGSAKLMLEKKPANGKKTATQSGKSIAATQPTTKKPRTGVEKMNAVLAKEETTQKLFELKKTKVKAETEKQVARVNMKADVKMQVDKLKANLAVKKMEFDFRLQMA